jgi:hypothetical protein
MDRDLLLSLLNCRQTQKDHERLLLVILYHDKPGMNQEPTIHDICAFTDLPAAVSRMRSEWDQSPSAAALFACTSATYKVCRFAHYGVRSVYLGQRMKNLYPVFMRVGKKLYARASTGESHFEAVTVRALQGLAKGLSFSSSLRLLRMKETKNSLSVLMPVTHTNNMSFKSGNQMFGFSMDDDTRGVMPVQEYTLQCPDLNFREIVVPRAALAERRTDFVETFERMRAQDFMAGVPGFAFVTAIIQDASTNLPDMAQAYINTAGRLQSVRKYATSLGIAVDHHTLLRQRLLAELFKRLDLPPQLYTGLQWANFIPHVAVPRVYVTSRSDTTSFVSTGDYNADNIRYAWNRAVCAVVMLRKKYVTECPEQTDPKCYCITAPHDSYDRFEVSVFRTLKQALDLATASVETCEYASVLLPPAYGVYNFQTTGDVMRGPVYVNSLFARFSSETPRLDYMKTMKSMESKEWMDLAMTLPLKPDVEIFATFGKGYKEMTTCSHLALLEPCVINDPREGLLYNGRWHSGEVSYGNILMGDSKSWFHLDVSGPLITGCSHAQIQVRDTITKRWYAWERQGVSAFYLYSMMTQLVSEWDPLVDELFANVDDGPFLEVLADRIKINRDPNVMLQQTVLAHVFAAAGVPFAPTFYREFKWPQE